ncbi:MAG: hypothetical protein IKF93_08980 [Lachnospiraceae bacterium]|nr:hypothetical protein [Lachnospiraceae bacterium]
MEKESLEAKIMAILRIREILERYSDDDHHLTQQQIIHYLKQDYGLILERKAVARDLSRLKEAGVEIRSDRKGSYLAARQFDDTELRILIDGVLSSRYISKRDSDGLIERLCELSSVYFSANYKHVYNLKDWQKEENPALLYNIDLINQAIEKKCQLEVTYFFYEKDKKRHKDYTAPVSPVALFLVEQEYLLLYIIDYPSMFPEMTITSEDLGGNNEQWLVAHPLRALTDLKLLDEKKAVKLKSTDLLPKDMSIPKFIEEFSLDKWGRAFINKETVDRHLVSFLCPSDWICRAIDYFGKSINISEIPELPKNIIKDYDVWNENEVYKNMVKISTYTTFPILKTFVLENAPFVTVISPDDAKEKMQEYIKNYYHAQKALVKAIEKNS